MTFPDRRTANILLTILFFAAVFAILYTARRILLIFVFAIIFVGHAFAPRTASMNSTLFSTLPVMIEGLSTGEIATEIGAKYGWSEAQGLRLKAFLVRHREQIRASYKVQSSSPRTRW